MMEKKILTISMLVSGREETTIKSLESLQPLRKELGAELILTDTGCTTEYLEKIKPYADKILSFTWCNDFAKARNLGLEVASGEWFLFIDDDEWFEDVTPIITFFQSGEYQEYHQAVYTARNYSNFEGTKYVDDWVSRMMRIEEDTHFEGSVHETLVPAKGKCKRLEAFVHHYGYVFATEEERFAHFQRNISILEKLAEEEPNNLKWALQLLQEYRSVNDMEYLQKTAEQSLALIKDVDKWFINMCRGSFYLALLMVDAEVISIYKDNFPQNRAIKDNYIILEDSLGMTINTDDEEYDGTEKINDVRIKSTLQNFDLYKLGNDVENKLWVDYKQFMEDKRNPWNVRCALSVFTYYQLLRIQNCNTTSFSTVNEIGDKKVQMFSEGNPFSKETVDGYDEKFGHVLSQTNEGLLLEEHLQECAKEYFYSLSMYRKEERTEQEQIIAESIVFVQDYMTNKVVVDMCYKCGEYAGENISVLIEDLQTQMAGNGEFLELPERIWELAQEGVLPLEELLLSLPISQWLVQMTVLQQKGYSAKWGAIGEHLASICTKGDIRYSYFDMVTETVKMRQIYILKENVEKMDYETMTQILSDFAQANVNYMEYIYTEQAFDGDMEILSETEQASVWIANGLSIDLSQWREKIQCFGNAAKVWPKMAELMKKYIGFVGQEAMAQLQ